MSRLTPHISELSPERRALLERLLEGDGLELDSPPVPKIPRRGDGATAPLSFSQQRLWFLDQFAMGDPALNVPKAYLLSGMLNVAVLEQAIAEIVRRHEILRTTFEVADGQPVQTVAPALEFLLPIVDLQALPPGERASHAQRLLVEEAEQPFDLARGPLIRTRLLRLSPDRHIFCLETHHIVSDAWSIAIFFQELAALYAAFLQGKPSPLPELPIQYADFAIWQRAYLQSEVLAEQLAYWRQQLADAPLLELPTDRPRPPVQTYRGESQSFALPTSLHERLDAFSRSHGVTPFMTLLATLNVLLHRYTGQEDILVGAPVAGRNRVEIERLIGCFLNHLVLRTDLSGDPTFQELLRRVRKTALDAYDHQDLPFEKLLEEFQPERDVSRTPFFQVFLNMPDRRERDLHLPGLTTEPFPLGRAHSNFDLTVYCLAERGGDLGLRFVYNPDLFSPARMAETVAQFHHLLEQILDSPAQRISQFSLVTPAAECLLPNPRQPLAADWHGAIHHRLAQHARQTPDKLALVHQQEQWTYEELDQRANRLAHYLIASGIQPQDIVAIYAHRSPALVWAILGTLKAGAATLILDPAYPVARLMTYVHETQPRGWLQVAAAGSPPAELTAFAATRPCRLELPAGLSLPRPWLDQPATDPGVPVGPDHLACLTFTSGSTGKPKGVLGRHGPLTHFLPWQQATFGLRPSDRFSMLSGLSHDPLQRDIFTALWVGATICIPEADAIGIPGRLAEWMAQMDITFAHLTPAMSQILTETAASDGYLPALRYAFFVGDKLTRHDVARLRRLAPHVTAINSYGSTETQRAVGYYLVPPASAEGDPGKAVYPIGRGMPDVQLLVLNAAQGLAGPGELGEIHIRSPHLARGYLGDNALTQTRFLPNPFTGIAGDRLYRTGDLGRYRPDGTVEFLGRADRQVKIRGFRIEPGEVEQALAQHPAVREAFVMLRDDVPGGQGLAAYLVGDRQWPPTGETLRAFLRDRLPDYMIPVVFVPLNALPLTPNGKVDVSALPAPDRTHMELDSGFVAPRTPVEKTLADIWQEVLGLDHVGIRDNFFELGGHSLLAIRLFAQIEKTFGKKLPLVALFQSPTVEQLAAMVQQEGPAPESSALVPIQAEGSKPPFFCVHGFGGGVMGYAELARLLGPDQPFYGLQARGLDSAGVPHTTIEEMAADYITAIHSVQPAGSYYLGGYCYGGVVAFEVARQLRARGEPVALLAILEGFAPYRPRARERLRPRAMMSFLRNLPHWLRDHGPQGYGAMRARVRRKAWAVRRRLSRGRDTSPVPIVLEDYIPDASQIPETYRDMVREVMEAELLAKMNYRPPIYPGRVTLFRVRTMRLFRAHDPELGWGKLAADGVEIKMIAGAHFNFLEQPHVQVLAAELKRSLAQAQAVEQSAQQPNG